MVANCGPSLCVSFMEAILNISMCVGAKVIHTDEKLYLDFQYFSVSAGDGARGLVRSFSPTPELPLLG